jgi:hypothetical protein
VTYWLLLARLLLHLLRLLRLRPMARVKNA